jgi:hypothetical protein
LTAVQLADPAATCGAVGVSCYDGSSAASLYSIRRWPTAPPAGKTQPEPWVSALRLGPGSCDHPYFADVPLNASPCRMDLYATVHFNSTVSDLSQQSVTATVAGQTITLAPPADHNPATSSNIWTATYDPAVPGAGVPVTTNSGSSSIKLTIDQHQGQVQTTDNKGQLQSNDCKASNASKSPCTVVVDDAQRTYGASNLNSGPISRVEVDALNPATGATDESYTASIPSCSSSPCNHDFAVRVDVASLHVGAPGERPVMLRVASPQGTQSLVCDPTDRNLAHELANGCNYDFRPASPGECDNVNRFSDLPVNPPNAWPCVETAQGEKTNAIDTAMSNRILAGGSTCLLASQQNHWPDYPNIPDNDPRRIHVFLTKFGAFSGTNGAGTVPIVSFAEFYITGWSGQGSGASGCPSNDPVPGDSGGYLVGHFIQAVVPGNGTPEDCDLTNTTDLRPCVAVLTQ